MGKGDRKTRRGKIYRGSYGNVRIHSWPSAVVNGPSSPSPKVIPSRKTVLRKRPV